MIPDILLALGGLGLFLVGMIALTDGLRRLVGASLRRLIARFTRTPTMGAVFGALTTAIIQSSNATIVTAIGFVGAGVLSFTQALGIVLGANVGTTVTGWLVALVSFKFSFGTAVLPLVLVGALLRLFGTERVRNIGWALAGFGMLFVGLDAMQQGMEAFRGTLTPDSFPGDTPLGWLQMALIGLAITLVTQSVTAGVAAALVALGAGTLSLSQAAAMVIGMDTGASLIGVLATLGGSAARRRTGYAHVAFNLATAVVGLALIGPYVAGVTPMLAADGPGDAQIALVAFHTLFNLVGAVLILPFAAPFARLVTAMTPERGPRLMRHLDDSLLANPQSAVDGALATIRDIMAAITGLLEGLLAGRRRSVDMAQLEAIEEALAATRGFIDRIPSGALPEDAYLLRNAAMHAFDHLVRLTHRCRQSERIERLRADHRLRRLAGVLGEILARAKADDMERAAERLDRVRGLLRDQRQTYRAHIIARSADAQISPEEVLARMDTVRWLHRVSYHLWRIMLHLHRAGAPLPARTLDDEVEQDLLND